MIYDVNGLKSGLGPIKDLGQAFPLVGGGNGERIADSSQTRPTTVPPLYCTLYRKDDGTRRVTVTDGSVIEVLQATGDSPKEHPVALTRDPTYPNLYREHVITATNCVVGVEFTVDLAGKITNTPSIAVLSVAASDSIHYIPAVGPSSGNSGYCFYALAKLTGSGDDDYLEVLHAGSNIDYVHDLSAFKLVNGATGKDIFKEFNATLGRYEYRGLAEDYGSPFEFAYDEAGADILLKWRADKNLDFTVKSYRLEARPDLEIPITLSVSAKTIEIPSSGVHVHALEPHVHIGYGNAVTTVGFTDIGSALPSVQQYQTSSVPDGAHTHTVTIPAETLSTTIQVPQAPVTVANSSYYTICWRDGIYVGIFSDGASTPPVDNGKALDAKTIWVLDRSTQADYSDTPTSQTFPIILL